MTTSMTMTDPTTATAEQLHDEIAAILPRIDAAIKRITDGQACMRIPAEVEDPDLVLADCKRLLREILAAPQPGDRNAE